MAFYHTACFVFTIMIICNAVLYPNLFSSVYRMWTGEKEPPQQKEQIPEYPPHMRGGMGPGPAARMRPSPGGYAPGAGPGASAGGARPPMGGPGGPDPSSFMANAPESRGRGMIGTVLPVYAVGIFIYFGYVMYKVFLREKPNSNNSRPRWSYPDDNEIMQDGPTPRREQQEKLQRQLAAELKAANYSDYNEKKRGASPKAASKKAATKASDLAESNDEVDVLKRRLEETEKNMQRMMEMMNSMGIAMNQVSHHLASSSDKPIPRTVLSKLNDPDEDHELDVDASDPLDLNLEDLSDEEDLLIGDRMEDDFGNEDDEEEIGTDAKDHDVEKRRSNKLNIVDVEADYDNDNDGNEDVDEGEGEVDSDDESGENIDLQSSSTMDSVRRRNVRSNENSESAGIEG